MDSPQAKTEGEKQKENDSLPQSFVSQKPAPSSEGAKASTYLTASAYAVVGAGALDGPWRTLASLA